MKLSELKKITAHLQPGADPLDATWRNNFIRSLGLDPKNLYQELEMDSRFVDTHRDVSRHASQVNLHSHKFYEILYCRSCEDTEYLIGTQRYRLQPGDVIIIPPGVSHCPILSATVQQDYIRDVLWLSTEFMNHLKQLYPNLFDGAAFFHPLLSTADPSLGLIPELFDRGVRESLNATDDSELMIASNTVTLLLLLRRACNNQYLPRPKAENPELTDRVVLYVEEHLSDKITLAEIAQQFYVSESTISQTFRKKMGTTLYHYITQRRLIAAKLLISAGTPLESISVQVGFSDYSSFYRAFRQEYGISPRQYRKL